MRHIAHEMHGLTSLAPGPPTGHRLARHIAMLYNALIPDVDYVASPPYK